MEEFLNPNPEEFTSTAEKVESFIENVVLVAWSPCWAEACGPQGNYLPLLGELAGG